MSQVDTTAVDRENARQAPEPGGQPSAPPPPRAPRGELFRQYKREQGKTVRMGTFIGAGLIIAWGAKYVYDRLQVYAGDEIANLLITTGIPILFAVVLGAFAWWIVFGKRSSGDFMIATQTEMKKVSWSSKREVIGATKVVILFTILLSNRR